MFLEKEHPGFQIVHQLHSQSKLLLVDATFLKSQLVLINVLGCLVESPKLDLLQLLVVLIFESFVGRQQVVVVEKRVPNSVDNVLAAGIDSSA